LFQDNGPLRGFSCHTASVIRKGSAWSSTSQGIFGKSC